MAPTVHQVSPLTSKPSMMFEDLFQPPAIVESIRPNTRETTHMNAAQHSRIHPISWHAMTGQGSAQEHEAHPTFNE